MERMRKEEKTVQGIVGCGSFYFSAPYFPHDIAEI